MKTSVLTLIVIFSITLCSYSAEVISGFDIQAETYTSLYDCTISNEHTGYTGSGYADYGNSGSYIEWDNIIAASNGMHIIDIRYETPFDRPCLISVNGITIGQLSFNSTTDWNIWESERIILPLNEGTNTIRIIAINAGPNIDKLKGFAINDPSSEQFGSEAENYTSLNNCTVSSDFSGYSGSGYIDYGSANSYIEWNNINVSADGLYYTNIRYASYSDRPCYISVNGIDIGMLNFDSTGSWSNWMDESIVLPMKSGANTIRITAIGSGPNIDKIDGEGLNIAVIPDISTFVKEAETAGTISGCTTSTLNSGYTGSGYVDYGNAGTYIQWNNVYVSESGYYTAFIRYASEFDRPCTLEVNGNFVDNIPFNSTGDWDIWKTESVTFYLNSGSNYVRITAIGAGPNIDNIEGATLNIPSTLASPSLDGFSLQAENTTSQYGCVIDNNNTGYNGIGYADYGSTGSFIEWNDIEVSQDGTYSVYIKYATINDRQCSLIVNDNEIINLAMKATGNWDSWASECVSVDLVSGVNSLRIATVADGPNIDKIEGAKISIEPSPKEYIMPEFIISQAEDYTSQSGCAVSSSHDGYTGNGYIDCGGAGTYIEWNNIKITYSGTYAAYVSYAAPYDRPCSVQVNGVTCGQIPCPATSDWDDWSVSRIDLPFNIGMNNVRITCIGSGPNIDQLEICGVTQCQNDTLYTIIEGGGPDQGPGRDLDYNIDAMLSELDTQNPSNYFKYGYGLQQIRLLSRSTDVMEERINEMCEIADDTGIPVWLHIDPIYAWGANTESSPDDAPSVKYWNDPEMREWREFPSGGQLPTYIPRFWFNWGAWCTPAPAFPAIGSPKFIKFACRQLQEGVLEPLSVWRSKWESEGREYLFAGINVGWETQIPYYSSTKLNSGIVASFPSSVAGLQIDPGLVGVETQFGYASLYWRGWTESSLQAAASLEGITYNQKLHDELYRCIHDYMSSLAKECANTGIGPDKVYTHIVALESAQYDIASNHPPIWTSVNPYSTPGFTLDNRGGAKFNLSSLKELIGNAKGNRGKRFGMVESYIQLGSNIYVTDAEDWVYEMNDMFNRGAQAISYYGSCPIDTRAPQEGIDAINLWIDQ